MKLIWSQLELARIAEITANITEDRPGAAKRWIEDTFEAVKRLSTFPLGGRIVPELNCEEVREIVQAEYRIRYRVESIGVSVLTVRHSRQLIDPDEFIDPELPA